MGRRYRSAGPSRQPFPASLAGSALVAPELGEVVEEQDTAMQERSLMSPEVVRGEVYGSPRFLKAHLRGDESSDAST